MKSLNDYLADARTGGYAIGHFNFATADVLRAIVESARDAGAPAVMVGTSEGEAKFIGMAEAVALVRALGAELQFPIFLNADHFKSVGACRAAVDAGYDSVLMDGSKLSLDENIAAVREVVTYARERNLPAQTGITVEGELGYLRGSSEVQATVTIMPDDYTKPDEAARFVQETGVDRLAIVFGNIHGIVTKVIFAAPTPEEVGAPTETSGEEHLDIPHFTTVAARVPATHLVLHGASGLADSEVQAAIKAGIVNVHFNTELRIAYAQALDKQLDDHPEETTPYKYLAPALDEVRKVVTQKISVFMNKK